MDRHRRKLSAKLDKLLDEKLREAAREGRPLGKLTIEATSPSGSVSVTAEDADRLGVLVDSVNARAAGGRPQDVPAQAGKAGRKLNYLQEPLAVVETDARRGRGILRSAEPREVEKGREYNEAVLEGGDSISIHRYRVEPGSRRRPVPSNISRDTLRRLVDDLTDILEPD
jgi:hypothetical protein